MIWHRVLVDGSVLSVIASLFIFASVRANPRLWLQDFPKDIRDAVPPKTPQERRDSLLWGVPFLFTLVAVPTASCVLLKRQDPGAATLAGLFLDAFGVMLVFNLVDLVVIDWTVVCAITPSFLVIPGTEGLAGYKDYLHHLRGFFIGSVGCALVASLIALCTYLL